jgi:hypothetical protein
MIQCIRAAKVALPLGKLDSVDSRRAFSEKHEYKGDFKQP